MVFTKTDGLQCWIITIYNKLYFIFHFYNTLQKCIILSFSVYFKNIVFFPYYFQAPSLVVVSLTVYGLSSNTRGHFRNS